MSQIFFSYSRHDSKFIDQLITDLEARGVSVWVDRGAILAGEAWRSSIVDAIRKCQVFVIVISPNSVKSENVTKELTLAEQYNKRVLPLVAANVEIPASLDYQLAGLHYQTFAEGDYEKNFQKLVQALKATGIAMLPKPETITAEKPKITEPIQKIGDAAKIASTPVPTPTPASIQTPTSEATPAATPLKTQSKVQPTPAEPQENPLTKVPIWLWAGGGAVILIVLSMGLFSLFGSDNPEELPTATFEVAELVSNTSTLEVINPSVIPVLEATNPPTATPVPSITPYPALIEDNFGLPMVLVPSGAFILGAEGADGDEAPVRKIELDSFYIDQFEVSIARYKECVKAGACSPPNKLDSDTLFSYYDDPAYADYPVIYVSWEDANAYCQWRGARLPTEAEWEKAARGPDGRRYPWGNEFAPTRANYCGGADWYCSDEPSDGYKDTAPVDSFASGTSLYGAYHLAGNVNEWVADWYAADTFSTLSDGDQNPTGPNNGQDRVVRGGSFALNANKLRSSNRGSANPSSSSQYDGFRCAIDLP